MLCLVIFLVGCLFVSLRFLWGYLPVFTLSRLPGGVQLLCFPLAPSQSVLPVLSGALGGLPGSLFCLPPGCGSSCLHCSLWWFGASATIHAGPSPGLSSASWLFHHFFPRVLSVFTLLDSRLLCSLASWLVLGSSFPVLVALRLPSIRGSLFGFLICLRGPLGCILLLSPRGLPLVSVSWGVLQALRMFFWPSYPSVSGLFKSGAVSGVPGSLFHLRCLTFHRIVCVPVCPRGSYGLDGFVLRTLRWCSVVSLLFVGLLLVLVRPILFLFSVSFCPFLGALLSELSSFLAFWSPLGSPFRSVAMFSGLLFGAGGVFLPSLPSWSVSSRGSPRLWRTPMVRGALTRVVLVLCLRFVSDRLPSFLPLLLLRFLRPGGCSFPWVGSSTTGVLAASSGDGFPGVVCSVVCLRSSSPLRCRCYVFFLRLRFVRRLSPSVVFFSAFAMGSPWSGSSVGYGFSHSIGTKA